MQEKPKEILCLKDSMTTTVYRNVLKSKAASSQFSEELRSSFLNFSRMNSFNTS